MANIYGIDVSEHNGNLDWAKIKAAGIKFAIIRTGYGVSHEDTQFKNNITGALAQGIPVGVYHFSYALDETGAKGEAAFVLSLLAPYKDKITLPVFFDFEYDTVDYAKKKGITLGKQAFNAHAVAFLEAVRAAGYTPGVYYNLDYKNRFVDASEVGGYVQWYAQYASKASWTGYDLWQYSSTFTISGHSCKFDINLADESIIAGHSTSGEGAPAAEVKEEFEMAKTWKNGSTKEPVYADTGKKTRVGSLNPYESCDCLGTIGGMYVVKYKVDGTNSYKVGLVSYAGGI